MANQSILLSRARTLRKHMTEAEHRLWFHFRSRRFNQWKFRRQVPMAPYILDFVCFSQQLIIEVDGSQHAENEAYDKKRTHILKEKGFRIIRFWNHDVLSETDVVLQKIHNELMVPPHPPTAPSPPKGEGPFCQNFRH